VSPFKPMKLKTYKQWIGQYGWTLTKSGAGDWKLLDDKGVVKVPFIKIIHPPGNEVAPDSVKKTEIALRDSGLE
jgi:hypothetical protein